MTRRKGSAKSLLELRALESLFAAAYPGAKRMADVRSVAARRTCPELDMDVDDIRQELLLAVWSVIERHDDGRALQPFIEVIGRNRAASIIRGARAKKRGRTDVPLDDIEDGHSVMLTLQLRLDVGLLLRKLSKRDRLLLLALVDTGPAQVARHHGTSRAAVYRAIQKLRALLLDGGYQ